VTQPRWALALACLASFMVGLDALVVTTALPAIGADLRAGLWGGAGGLAVSSGPLVGAALTSDSHRQPVRPCC
jgi:hypothetical protein